MSRLTRLTRPAGFAAVLVASFAVGVVLATTAYAHHPEITASADCDGVITFTSEAWASTNEDQRTNPDIRISVSTDGGPFVDLPANAAYHYDAANDFQFTDTFTPTAGWTTVNVRATAMAPWASGAGAGDRRTSNTVTPLTDCDDPLPAAVPAASIAGVECADDGVAVQLTNTGGEPVEFTITGGTVDQLVTVAGGETVDLVVDVPGGTTSVLTITADGMETVTREVSTNCVEAPVVVPAPAPAPTTTTTAAPTPTTVAAEESGGDTDAREADAAAREAARVAALAADTSGQLPVTGSSTTGFLVAGVLALVAGGAIVIASRRSQDQDARS